MAKKVCSYCGEPILEDEAVIQEPDGWIHLSCSVEESDGFDIDNEHGDN